MFRNSNNVSVDSHLFSLPTGENATNNNNNSATVSGILFAAATITLQWDEGCGVLTVVGLYHSSNRMQCLCAHHWAKEGNRNICVM